MRVVLAGASGLIGSALRASLTEDGHLVTVLVRRPPSTDEEREWAPQAGHLDPEVLADAAAVVCLSGAGVGDRRWTASYKATLRSSRIDSVATLSRAMARAGAPAVLLSASAVGYYGDTGESTVEEGSPRGQGFLAELCQDWEQASAPAAAAGIRVAQLRTGIVLTRRGGLLKRLVPIVKAGVAGRLGTGRQFMPWVSLLDEVNAIRYLLDHDVSGPVNLCAPAPARNRELIATLAALLHRPAVLAVPAPALRLALGEFAGEALASQRVVPAVLASAGFTHAHPTLDGALSWAMDN